MKYEIRYHTIQSDHLLAVPEFSHKEIVDAKTRQHVIRYVKKQKDEYGHHYKYHPEKRYGFDFTSNAGGVKIRKYKPPKVKRI
jgi:hypothetical protein